MNIKIPLKVRNEFEFIKRNTRTGKETRYKSHNIVLDNFFRTLVSSAFNARIATLNPSNFPQQISGFVTGIGFGIGGTLGEHQILSNGVPVVQLSLKIPQDGNIYLNIRAVSGQPGMHELLIVNHASSITTETTLSRIVFRNVAGEDNIGHLMTAWQNENPSEYKLTNVTPSSGGTGLIQNIGHILIKGNARQQNKDDLKVDRSDLFHRVIGVGPTIPETGISENPDGFFVQLDISPYSAEIVCRLRNGQGNGILTEVGLVAQLIVWDWNNSPPLGPMFGANSGIVVTHSLITDAEDNPLPILKTDEETLEIRAKIFGEYSTTGAGYEIVEQSGQKENSPIPTEFDDINASFPEQHRSRRVGIKDSCIGMSPLRQAGQGQITMAAYRHKLFLGAISKVRNGVLPQISEPIININSAQPPHSFSADGPNQRLRQAYRFYATDANILAETYPIKTIDMGGLFLIQYPNDDFGKQPVNIIFENIPESQLDFEHQVWGLNTDDVIILVNGVVRDKNDDILGYRFTGKNLKFKGSWESGWTENMVEGEISCAHVTSSANNFVRATLIDYAVNGTPTRTIFNTEPSIGLNRYAIWDYKRPKTIDTIRQEVRVTNWGDGAGTILIEASDNGTDWRVVDEVVTEQNQSWNIITREIKINPDTARYWRASLSASPENRNETWILLMDEDVPWLRFNSPIPAGSTVEVRATTSYPIKNERKQFILDTDIILTRGLQ